MAENKFVQREKRFEVGNISNFEAIVRRGESDDTVFFAELLDFSRSGLKFRLPFSARFDEKLKIRLTCKNSDLEYSGIGRVRHIRNTDVNRWIVGCSIEPVLCDDLISFLASATQQERRKCPRLDVNAIGRLSRQGSIDETNAQVRNVSKGGFCLFVSEQHEAGSRVNLTLENKIGYEEKIAARVRWHRKHNDGFLLGLCYADNEAYDKLIDCLDLPHDTNNSIIGSMSWKLVAAAMVAMLLPSLSYLLLGASLDPGTATKNNERSSKFSPPQNISNPFVVDNTASKEPVGRPDFEDTNDGDNGPPPELTSVASVRPRRLRVEQSADSTNVEDGQLTESASVSRNFELYSVHKQQEASTRRGESKKNLLVPSEVIRKRLLD